LLRNGQVLGGYNANFVQAYAVTAAIYIVINFGLSRIAEPAPATPAATVGTLS
jgi:ABC-type amino acid transport system permease subunit